MGDRRDASELDGRQLEAEAPSDWERRVRGLPPADARDPAAALHVIVQVSRAGHVPEHMRVRAGVSTTLLTGETTFGELPALASDPLVVSIAVGERIGPSPR